VTGAAEAKAAGRKAGPVIDCHAHLTHHSSAAYQEKDRKLIEAADKLGIDRLCCSILTPRRPATAEGFRECNAWLAEAMKRFGDRVLGYCYVNPGYGRQAVEEVRRCVEDRGFIGVKLYNEHVCTDPVVFPVVELAIKLRVPILHHAGHAHYPLPGQPRISDGGHLAELARRYGEARLICAHVGGGGDWEWTVKAHRDRLIPLAVINPFYAGWQDDLKTCHEQFGMKGLRLYPKWHNYALSDRSCLDLIHEATERGMVVSIPIRVEDFRQRSWLVDVPDVPLGEIVVLVKACPKARFVLLNGAGYTGSPLGQKDNGLPANYFIEISRLSALLANEVAQLVSRLGPERVVFGSGMPFKYPDPALLKLEVDNCDLSGFGHAAICLTNGEGHHVHHNFIHHCQHNGLGYGVSHGTASSLIEFNLFDFNRHSIAGTGRPGCDYIARSNVELGTSLSHCFDMHGGRDRKDGTDVAGTSIEIYNNTFRAPQTPMVIRGVPQEKCDMHHNWFLKHNEAESAVRASAKTKAFDNAYGPDAKTVK